MGDAIIALIVFFSILMGIRYILDFFLKMKLINKGLVDENAKLFFGSYRRPADLSPTFSSLKWGLVLVAVSVGLFYGMHLYDRYPDEIALGLTFSAILFLSGAALILYYFIAMFVERRNKSKE